MTSKIFILLADGFEETEALLTTDYLRRAGLDAELVSTTGRPQVVGSHKITVTSDVMLSDISAKDALAVVMPGGVQGAESLRDNPDVIDFVKAVADNGQLTAAICAGPIVLGKAGLLTGKVATCYPGFDAQLPISKWVKGVHQEGKVLTGEGPALTPYFAYAIIKALGSDQLPALKKAVLQSDLEEYMASDEYLASK